MCVPMYTCEHMCHVVELVEARGQFAGVISIPAPVCPGNELR